MINHEQAVELARKLRSEGRTINEIRAAVNEAGYVSTRTGRQIGVGGIYCMLNKGRYGRKHAKDHVVNHATRSLDSDRTELAKRILSSDRLINSDKVRLALTALSI